MNKYVKPEAERIDLFLANIIMTSAGEETTQPETGKDETGLVPFSTDIMYK